MVQRHRKRQNPNCEILQKQTFFFGEQVVKYEKHGEENIEYGQKGQNMKLSMWIIANLLEPFEPEVHIRRESPRVLRSARLAYATDCVLVQQDGKDCLYLWNEDSIRLPDLSAREGFELLQSLFDSMFDWQGRIASEIEKGDFKALVEEMGVVFKNPIALTDANHACLACSGSFGPEDVDREWQHLKTYGYSSFASAKEISEARLSYHMDGKVIRFRFPKDSGMSDSLSVTVFQGEMPVGYLTIVEKAHPMNDGHMQLMVMLAKALAPALGREQRGSELNGSMLQRFLEGSPMSDAGARNFLEQRGWTEADSFRVYILDFDGVAENQGYRKYFAAIAAVFPLDLSGVFESRFVLLANDSKMPDVRRRKKLEELLNVAPVSGGVSLSRQGFDLLPQLLEQAEFALQSPRKKEGHFTDYYYLALDHLIRSSYDPNRCLAACHPDVYRLFRQDEVLYQTLWAYLLQDRSVTRTVQMLYVHKNTLLYRLRRIEESLQFDLSDPYTRSYMRTSFFLLERHAGLSDPPVPAFDPSGISSE